MKYLLVLFLSLFAGNVIAAPNEAAEVETIQITDSIYMLATHQGGNIGALVGDDGILLVDDLYAANAEKVQAALDQIGEGKPEFILNTHWHQDHTDGNRSFGPQATIIAHRNVRKRLSEDQYIKIFDKTVPAQTGNELPAMTFSDSFSIHFNDEVVEALHFPSGHTDGDSVIFFRQSNVVHLGDHFFNGFYPFIDTGSGGSVEGYIANVAKLIEIIPSDADLIPGHGSMAKVEDLKNFHQMLLETSGLVKQAIQEGVPQSGVVFPDRIVEEWGDGFLNTEQFIGILYEGQSA